jgi:tetrahydromethanopterin S-methyltransferase subunit G
MFSSVNLSFNWWGATMLVMTQQILFDRTRYTDKLRENGVDEKTAPAHGEALDGALREGVVTQTFLKEQLGGIDAKFDAKFFEVDKHFADIDKRFDEVDRRFDKIEARVDKLETKLESKIDAVEVRFDAKLDKLESKVITAISESKQQLTWLIVGALVVQFASRLIK